MRVLLLFGRSMIAWSLCKQQTTFKISKGIIHYNFNSAFFPLHSSYSFLMCSNLIRVALVNYLCIFYTFGHFIWASLTASAPVASDYLYEKNLLSFSFILYFTGIRFSRIITSYLLIVLLRFFFFSYFLFCRCCCSNCVSRIKIFFLLEQNNKKYIYICSIQHKINY